MTLRVIDPGLYTLVVDGGRPASRSLGVPVSGAADRTSLALGNALLDNPPEAAALEITLSGPTLVAEAMVACACWGAPFPLASDRQGLRVGRTFTLAAGEQLHIGSAAEGMRGYLCVRGGFDLPLILGSRSGFEPLRAGVQLPCSPSATRARFLGTPHRNSGRPIVLRALAGAQADWFRTEQFYGRPFRVSPASNRMGLRLRGEPLDVPDRELLSEPVCPGSVQVTRDSQCIVLGVDGQTIGGYPKIAQVITADLDRVGQLRPEDELRFTLVTLEEAEQLQHSQRRELLNWLTRLRETAGDL
jgi:antagonist of KipI